MRRIAFLFWLFVPLAGACAWSAPSSVCMGGAVLDSRGFCVAQQAPVHHLPFREGKKVKVTQGFYGHPTHKERQAFAVDFACEEGEPIVASRSGKVWQLKEDSNVGCPDASCVALANYVILDHGNGSYSGYYHLRHFGVLVDEGDEVCAGQIIGVCGSTGYSVDSHLHFALMDASHQTIPVQFAEARNAAGFGTPVPRTEYKSTNNIRTQCRIDGYSSLDRAAFAHQGIILEDDIPIVIEANDDRRWRLEGHYTGKQETIVVHRRPKAGGEWSAECVRRGVSGDFDVNLVWAPERFPKGSYLLMVTGGDAECRGPGWAWSYEVLIR